MGKVESGNIKRVVNEFKLKLLNRLLIVISRLDVLVQHVLQECIIREIDKPN